jgi:hypothetical protein
VVSIVPNRNLFGREAVIAGWGKNNNGEMPFIMETVNLTIISNSECAELATRLNRNRIFITHAEICTVSNPYSLMESVSIHLLY